MAMVIDQLLRRTDQAFNHCWWGKLDPVRTWQRSSVIITVLRMHRELNLRSFVTWGWCRWFRQCGEGCVVMTKPNDDNGITSIVGEQVLASNELGAIFVGREKWIKRELWPFALLLMCCSYCWAKVKSGEKGQGGGLLNVSEKNMGLCPPNDACGGENDRGAIGVILRSLFVIVVTSGFIYFFLCRFSPSSSHIHSKSNLVFSYIRKV